MKYRLLIAQSKMKIRCHSIRKLLFVTIFCGICAYVILNVLLRINDPSIASEDSSTNRRTQMYVQNTNLKSLNMNI